MSLPAIGPYEFSGWVGTLQSGTGQGRRPSQIQTSSFAESYDLAWLLASAYAELVGPNSSLQVVTPGGAVYSGVTVGGIQILRVRKVVNRLGTHQVDVAWELYV